MVAGLLAGVAAFGVAYVVGEPSVNAAIALEQHAAHEHDSAAAHTHDSARRHAAGGESEPFSRTLQSTAGLLTATLVAGGALGGLAGVLTALALGRFGGLGVRGTALAVSGLGFLSLYAVPFLVYPPNPPAVGQSDTIGLRTALYFTMLAISVVAGVAAVLVGRRLALAPGRLACGSGLPGRLRGGDRRLRRPDAPGQRGAGRLSG